MDNKGCKAFRYFPKFSTVSAVFVLLYTCSFLFVSYGLKTIHYSFPSLLNTNSSS